MFPGDTFYARANFEWARHGVVLGGTESAGALCDGDFLRVTNVPSKTDRSGMRWVGRHMWYRLDRSNPLNFPAAWERYELTYPCPAAERARWAAFSPTAGPEPFKPARFRAAFGEALSAAGGVDVADRHHFHDFRATVASALKGLGKDDATVQAVVCWASPESVALYGQMLPANMADLADMVTRTDAARTAHMPRPCVCPEDVARELEACASYLGGSTAKAPTGARKPKRAAVASPPAARRRARKGKGKARVAAVGSGDSASGGTASAPVLEKRKAEAPVDVGTAPAGGDDASSALPALAVSRVDVGPPHGVVDVDTSSRLAGQVVRLPNEIWEAGAAGITPCRVAGPTTDDALWVVVGSDDGHAYALAPPIFRHHLTKRHRALLPSSQGGRRLYVSRPFASRPAPPSPRPKPTKASPATAFKSRTVVRQSPRLARLTGGP